MNRFISSINDSLKSENWYSALFLALTLPDICCRLESKSNRTSGPKYAAWFEKYLSGIYTYEYPDGEIKVFLSGDDCYALRCAMLHQGEADLAGQAARSKRISRFHFTIASCHGASVDDVLQLDVRRFCEDICNAVIKWLEDFELSDKLAKDKLSSLLQIHIGPSNVGFVRLG